MSKDAAKPYMCCWYEAAVDDLSVYAEKPTDWHDTIAVWPDKRIVRSASAMLASLARIPWMPQPFIDVFNGKVRFNWSAGSRLLDVVLAAEAAAEYTYTDYDIGEEVTGITFGEEPLNMVIGLVAKTMQIAVACGGDHYEENANGY
jgi:hypothetical protein